MTISFGSQEATLLPEKAVLVGSALVLADTHFGKSAAFRARGIPIPEGDTEQDTTRILNLLERHRPTQFIIAGDFLHAAEGKSPAVLASLSEFFSRVNCETHLALGNHDLRAGSLPTDWPVTIHDQFELGEILVVHDPADAPEDRPSLCGHLHPVARIKDGKQTAFRAPCFWLSHQRLVLPSFGTFTGGAVVRPAEDERIFTPLNHRVVELPLAVL